MQLSTDRKIALVLLVIAGGYLAIAFQIPSSSFSTVSSAVLPKVLGGALVILSIVMFFQNEQETEEERAERKLARSDVILIGVTLASMVVYALVLQSLGFLITTLVFLIGMTRFFGFKNWIANIIVSVCVTGVIYFLFNYVLQVFLPQGPLPF